MLEDKNKVSDHQDDRIVNNPENLNDDDKNNPAEDYKKDMFKFKNKYKDAETKAQELERKIKDFELKEKQREGNYEEVIDSLKDQLREEMAKNKNTELNLARTSVKRGVENHLKENGCVDTDAFIRLMGDKFYNTINLDKETLEPNKDDISLVVQSEMKKYEHLGLFKKNVNIVDGVPRNDDNFLPTKKPISKMTPKEIEEELRTRFRK